MIVQSAQRGNYAFLHWGNNVDTELERAVERVEGKRRDEVARRSRFGDGPWRKKTNPLLCMAHARARDHDMVSVWIQHVLEPDDHGIGVAGGKHETRVRRETVPCA
ncbi:hypothetical protein PsorP6_019287 [Peronosclerospora sorghi]|nr:hypothetical protein PsorP6_019287 [Peronosclerospora sorghi]